MKRASRTGPLFVTDEGTVLLAPSRVASFTCGFGIGLCGTLQPGAAAAERGLGVTHGATIAIECRSQPDPGFVSDRTRDGVDLLEASEDLAEE